MDTNFLMVPAQFNVDIFGELSRIIESDYELVVPDKVLAELTTLSKKGNLKERKASRIGLELAKRMKTLEVGSGDVDDVLFNLIDERTVVCTNDKALKKRIRDKGGRIIYLKQKRFLELDGGSIGVS